LNQHRQEAAIQEDLNAIHECAWATVIGKTSLFALTFQPSKVMVNAARQPGATWVFLFYPWEYGKAFDYKAIFPTLSTRAVNGT
jgi:hypothetical protein